MRIANWVLLALTASAVVGMLYGMSFPGEPSDAFIVAALTLVPLFIVWCVVAVVLWLKGGRRDWPAILACPVLVIAGIALACTNIPLQLHWWVAQPSFEAALTAFESDETFGHRPHRIAGYTVEDISRRTDNFVDFSRRDDMNGADGFAYSVDGSPPETVHHAASDYVMASVKRLGPHWFAFQSYHTMN
ncbi:hypothetical protein [Mycolicibacterium brisbanense]|uniref:Uncharacterized protein n=1 Tax=Mycolicibacterium brisbanense TaxID=146020 RepID=A0A124E0F2_9MYCO|nr:hypothetical protein [Mycolicibacterium brisbanense]MCV7157701.1 hypothetical protein [Mycolicibacterium brisbanense]GAS90348.1 uncharacterized protein RMCB_4444 [Mycolicibacterium brisbanense]